MNSAAIQSRARRAAGLYLPPWDTTLLAIFASLVMLGLVMVFSASVDVAEAQTGNGFYYFVRHLAHIAIGLIVMRIVMQVAIVKWEEYSVALLLAGIVLLVLALIPGLGMEVNGSSRWIRAGAIRVQPSELVKIFVICYVAGYLVRRQDELLYFSRGVLTTSVVLAVVGTLLLLQPDFGTVAVICMTVFTMLFLAGVRLSHFFSIVTVGLGGMLILTMVSPYRVVRIASFLDPWADPFNSGFQLVQALIAFGRGEWFGAGLGESVQKLSYLPAAHTDFIFAVLAEELGFVGSMAVFILFGALIWRGFVIAYRAEVNGFLYGARLAQGITLLFATQTMVNLGVNMGVLPTKGLTLPFLSAGGSSIVASCAALGILLRIEHELRHHRW